MFNGNSRELVKSLAKLERENIIKRIGFYENLIVLTEFATKWCTKVNEIYLIPAPWLTLNMEIRRDIFLKWAGVVMNKIFENPGCSMSYLSDMCEFLTSRAVHDVCVFLMKCKCVNMNVLKAKEVDLFSDDDYLMEVTDYHEYDSPNNIIAFPLNNSLTRYAHLRKLILENYDTVKRSFME